MAFRFRSATSQAAQTVGSAALLGVTVLSIFAPVYLAVVVTSLLPVGGFNDLPVSIFILIGLLLPIAWLAVSDALVFVSRVGLAVALRVTSKPIHEVVGDAIGVAVLVAMLMSVFSNFSASVIAALIAYTGYRVMAPVIERWVEDEALPESATES